MNRLDSPPPVARQQDLSVRDRSRKLKRTYRFADGVRVMVWAYDLVVWVYPDGQQVASEGKGCND